ncbi:S41 family peptidase [Gehongia tenuis]|uniref:S41 family peptidase n=1 Tax=Gehongia tenuis TaxID=2763655 RepID=A0A926D3K0_9FIRM|nr:S41 family peptidase [Gehongia tenuis]MBC8530712.1 S41 family peptidase [Gehongia tenuis]
MRRKTLLTSVALVLLIAITAGGTYYLTRSAIVQEGTVLITEEAFQQYKQYERLAQVQDYIKNNYITEVDDETLVNGAVKGMAYSTGDLYSAYYTPEEYAELQQEREGAYAGAGFLVTQDPDDGLVTVLQVFTDSPAAKAGVAKADKIVKVDGEDVRGLTTDAIVDRVKGEKGTDVVLTMLRGGEEIDFTLTRDDVVADRTEYEMLDDGILYIHIVEFSGNDVTRFKEAMDYGSEKGAKGIIVDLRDNPGGLLSDSVAIADLLVPEGLVVYTEDRYGNRVEETSDAGCWGKPLVLLVNENSASASEILAGAVQDYGVGKLVGTKTFGKGIVQSIHQFQEDGAAIKITTSYYYTPSGRCIHGTGIIPDVESTLPEDLSRASLNHDNDTQLKDGIKVLKEMMAE